VIGSVSIAERGSEIDAFGGDVLLIAVLPVEVENVFDGPEVAGFVWGSGCIFDVVERLVFSGSCDSCAGVGAGALEALVTVAMCVFLTTERLDAGGASALDQRFEKDCFEVLVSDGLGKRGERRRFVVADTQFEPHVDCGVHGVPRFGHQRQPAFTGVSYY